MICVPTLSDATFKVAIPAAETLPVPMAVPPSRNVTVPENDPPLPVAPLCTTVAVNCSVEPAIAGFALAAMVVAVAIDCTVSVTPGAVDTTLLASPP